MKLKLKIWLLNFLAGLQELSKTTNNSWYFLLNKIKMKAQMNRRNILHPIYILSGTGVPLHWGLNFSSLGFSTVCLFAAINMNINKLGSVTLLPEHSSLRYSNLRVGYSIYCKW